MPSFSYSSSLSNIVESAAKISSPEGMMYCGGRRNPKPSSLSSGVYEKRVPSLW